MKQANDIIIRHKVVFKYENDLRKRGVTGKDPIPWRKYLIEQTEILEKKRIEEKKVFPIDDFIQHQPNDGSFQPLKIKETSKTKKEQMIIMTEKAKIAEVERKNKEYENSEQYKANKRKGIVEF
jgi:hypothetical protein